ncbi:MAG: tetratricopeptide repeat protein [Methanomassiliicoccales archaeon]|nr:MAG: tetratricopeptide repeat protein [Methanomassiliicoccales archaeon]
MGRQGKMIATLYSKFIGREDEMEEAKDHLNESIKGNGRLVLIVGETGIGKSRFTSELGKYAESQGVLFLNGKSLYQENAEPYLPFIEAFGRYLSSERDFGDIDSRAVIGGASDEPFSLGLLPLGQTIEIPDVIKKPSLNLQEERDRLFESLCNLVIDISENTPLLLVLDDLQWADDGTLQLLHYLARNIRSTRVMICGTYCPEDLNNNGGKANPFPETIRRMRIENLFFEIALKRFDERSTALMIESLVGKQGLPDEFVKILYEESEGNPFFVEEVLRSLVNEGLIDVDSYKWTAKFDASQIRIPSTIRDVIARRIDTLDDGTRAILRCASVIGNSFTFELLRRISDVDEEVAIDAIDASIEANIIHEDISSKEERYKFDHALIREVIFSSMSKSRRRLMHKRIGYIIEELNKDRLDEVVYNLVHHFREGKDAEKTLLYTIMAGDKATKAFAPEEAIHYYQFAISALEEMGKGEEIIVTKLAVMAKLGEIFAITGKWDLSLEYHDNALVLSEKIDNKLEKARAYRSKGHIKQNKWEYESALKNFKLGLSLSKNISDIHGMADTYRGMGRVFWRKGEFERAIEYYEKSLSLTKEVEDEKTMATTYIEMGNVYSELGEWEKAIEYQTNSLKILEKNMDFYEIGRSYNNIGVTYARKGDTEKAIEQFEKSIEFSNKTGNIRMAGWALFNAAEAYAKIGEFEKALDCCNRSLSIFERLDEKIGISGSFMSYGIIYKLQKQWDRAIKYFEKSMRIRKELKIPYRLADGYFEFGLLYKEKGDANKASDYLKKAGKIFSNLGANEFLEKVEVEMKSINGMKCVEGG